jgi:hypothetical protein
MTCAINLTNARLHVDSKHTCDHQVDVSINTMKYLNGPPNGCIISQMSPWILSKNLLAVYVS